MRRWRSCLTRLKMMRMPFSTGRKKSPRLSKKNESKCLLRTYNTVLCQARSLRLCINRHVCRTQNCLVWAVFWNLYVLPTVKLWALAGHWATGLLFLVAHLGYLPRKRNKILENIVKSYEWGLWATLGYFRLVLKPVAQMGYSGLLWATVGYCRLVLEPVAQMGYSGLLWATVG